MVKWFLAPESAIPRELGFRMYGPEHLAALCAILLVSAAVLARARHMHEGEYRRLLRAEALAMVLLELLKELVMGLAGTFSTGYLPLHLCSLGMFVCLWAAWHPENRGAGQILYSVFAPGALCALLFPDWTAFPIWHFQSLHSFIWHALLLQCSLLPLARGSIWPGVRQSWRSMLFLVCAAVPVYCIDRLLRVNYMFLLQPSAGSPLEPLAALTGAGGYLPGLFVLAALVVLADNLPFDLIRLCRNTAMPKKHG